MTLRRTASLTLRDDWGKPKGSTALSDGVQVESPYGFELFAGHFLVFVHGYNVHYIDACRSYGVFLRHLERCHPGPISVLELHWPGDRKWGKLAGLCYPLKIGTAREAGGMLAKWIIKSNSGARFMLVGHSLGCRLVLETVKVLREEKALARLSAVCLMAAAVPAVVASSPKLGPVPGEDLRWQVLHSCGDTVLRWLFPLGQAARSDSFLENPVGLHGDPKYKWRAVSCDLDELYHGPPGGDAPRFYDHGDYWGVNLLTNPCRSAKKVAAMLKGIPESDLRCNHLAVNHFPEHFPPG